MASESVVRTSAQETIERFDTAQAAAKYSRSLVGSGVHRRETHCLREALKHLPRGSRVLDLPCGTARLLPFLLEMGFEVVEADSSPHMVEQARAAARRAGLDRPESSFLVADALSTPFKDDQFDAVVCNRLIHHFREPAVRQACLRELSRICRGPLVVSFFCSQSWDGLSWRIKQAFAREKATDRIPIPLAVLEQDIRAAGLELAAALPTRGWISKQWYVVLRRKA